MGQIVVERLFTAILNRPTDEKTVAAGIPKAELCLKAVERIKGDGKFLAGNQPSLADLYFFPVLFYLMMAPEKTLMESRRGSMSWWETMNQRASVKQTQPNF
jgi:glutathione S-transferase